MDRGRHQAGGHQDEDEAGNAEEAGKVDAHAAAVEQVAQHDRNPNAEHGTSAGGQRIERALEGGEHEDGGLETLTQDRDEGHADERQRGADQQRALGVRLELAFHLARVVAHPDDHVGHADDGHQRQRSLEQLALPKGKRFVEHRQGDRHCRADRHGQTDADPDGTQRVFLVALDDEGGNDADDQRRLEALAQADDKRRQQVLLRRLGLDLYPSQ